MFHFNLTPVWRSSGGLSCIVDARYADHVASKLVASRKDRVLDLSMLCAPSSAFVFDSCW
jgi:hypothetical protein